MWRTGTNRIIDWVFKVIVVGFITGGVLTAGYELIYLGRIYPGVKIGGMAVGGMTPSQAGQAMTQTTKRAEKIVLHWGVNQWTQNASDMGISYNVLGSVSKAVRIGRQNDLIGDIKAKLSALRQGLNVKPVISINEADFSTVVDLISSQIDVPAKEPDIVVTADKVDVSAGENGHKVDTELMRKKISEYFESMGGETVDVPVIEMKPKLSAEQIQMAKQRAEGVLGKKITLLNSGTSEKWEITQEQILSWIDLQSGGWAKDKIADWIRELAVNFDMAPQNATFRFVNSGKVEEFKPAKNGRILVVDQTVAEIIIALDKLTTLPLAGSADAVLVAEEKSPEISNDQVNDMGINQLIGKGESWFSGSINNRIFNLKKAADALNGILIAPEEIFSFNKAVGEISANTGYKQAYIIKEGKTILGDGGGVCQVSSTLFRAVLAAGLPIEERTAHAYRVHYYEEKYQVGFDATVFQPSPDFKFKNDTGAYILIQTVYDEKQKYLAFEFYGTSDGRKAEISKSRIWEVASPPPDLYIDDPTLPVGKVVQTEHAAWGAKVAFDWKVVRGDEVLQQRTFYSNYRPWQAVYMKGTKPL